MSGLRCLTKTVQNCCDMRKGRLLHVPAVFSCLKSFMSEEFRCHVQQRQIADDWKQP